MKRVFFAGLLGLALISRVYALTPALNGSFDGAAIWGAPIATATDGIYWQTYELGSLYYTMDATYVYFLVTRNNADDWQYAAFALNVGAGGGPSDPWTRAVNYDHSNKPDYVFISQWNDSWAELRSWNGGTSSWDGAGVDKSADVWVAGDLKTMKIRIAKSALGNPAAIDVQCYQSGDQNFHGCFDSIPDGEAADQWDESLTPNTLNTYVTGLVASAFTVDVDDDYTTTTPGWGITAFSVIQPAVDIVDAGGTVNVRNGNYLAFNGVAVGAANMILISKPLTLQGESRAGVVIMPAAEDVGLIGQAFDGSYQHGILVKAHGVTIRGLTVDGSANNIARGGTLANHYNFRIGILNYDALNVYGNNLRIEDVGIHNIRRRGVSLYPQESTGHVVTNCEVSYVEYQQPIYTAGPATITHNTIHHASCGIAVIPSTSRPAGSTWVITHNILTDITATPTSYYGSPSGWLVNGIYFRNPNDDRTVIITDNQITMLDDGDNDLSFGMYIYNSDASSVIENNTFNLTSPNLIYGPAIYLAGCAGTTVRNNVMSMNGELHGIDLGRGGSGVPVPNVITGNTITSINSTSSSFPEGTGIFQTNNATYDWLGESQLNKDNQIYGNTISGFVRGIVVDGSTGGGNNCAASIAQGNRIDSCEIAIQVNGSKASATIDTCEIDSNTTGILADAGVVTVKYATILNNSWGVLARNDATVGIEKSLLYDNTDAALENRNPSLVVAAFNNYWGAASGPSGPGFIGSGDVVLGSVTATPWSYFAGETAADVAAGGGTVTIPAALNDRFTLHQVVIPGLNQDGLMRIVPPTDRHGVDNAAEFLLEGATLTGNATVTIQYDPATDLGGIGEEYMRVAKWNGSGWDVIFDTVVDQTLKTVSAKVSSFSIYAAIPDNSQPPAPNDPPVITAPASRTTTEDVAITFSGASRVSVADPDAASGMLQMRLRAVDGTLTLGNPGAVSIVSGTHPGSDFIIEGNLTDLNLAIDNLVYLPPLNFSGTGLNAATIFLTVDDEGNSGDGGPQIAMRQVLVNVVAKADVPLLALPPASGDEDTPIALPINASLADTDGSEVLTVLVNGVPAGASLSAGTDLGGGSWQLTQAQLPGLTLSPPPQSDVDFSLGVTATAREISNNDTASTSGLLAVTINAVADAPNLTVANASGDEDTAISLTISSSLVDTDGSESLLIILSDVPAGASLTAGTDQGGGVWHLAPAQLAGLQLIPPPNSDVDFTMTVTARATEAANNDQVDTVRTIDVVLNAVADMPILNVVSPATGDEDTTIPLSISAALADTDGSETLSITIGNVPPGVTLSSGTYMGSGLWSFDDAQLPGLYLTLVPNDFSDFTLLVAATATESANSDTATANASIFVDVNPVNDPTYVDLNGPYFAGTDWLAHYTQGGAAVSIVRPDNTISDVDSTQLTTMTLTILNPLDGAQEWLSATAGGGVTVSYTAPVLTLTGPAPFAAFEAVLATATYYDVAPSPTFEPARQIRVVAFDGQDEGVAATVTVRLWPNTSAKFLVFVDDDWASKAIGAPVLGLGGIPATIGDDAYARINDALVRVASGGTVFVAAGTYFENVLIPAGKALNLSGAKVTQAPSCDFYRGSLAEESVIEGGSWAPLTVGVRFDWPGPPNSVPSARVDGFTIRNFDIGICAEEPAAEAFLLNGVTIANNIIEHCGDPLPPGGGANDGQWHDSGMGMRLLGADNCVIEQNVVRYCQRGIHIGPSSAAYNATAENNLINLNCIHDNERYGIGGFGLAASGLHFDSNQITHNTIYKNADRGIAITGATHSNNQITDNTILNNTGDGIQISGASGGSILRNNIRNNAFTDQTLSSPGTDPNTGFGSRTARGGIVLLSTDGACSNITIEGNTIRENGRIGAGFAYWTGTTQKTSCDGVYIAAGSGAGVVLHNNKFSINEEWAIQCDNASVTLDATNNWWGTLSWYGYESVAGIKDRYFGQATWEPWKTEDLLTSLNKPDATFSDPSDMAILDGQTGHSGGLFGYNEFRQYADAYNHVNAGGTLTMASALYIMSNTQIAKALTVQGASRNGVVVAPGGEDDNLDSMYGGTYQVGFIISASNVTIRNLTIDGQANPALTSGKNNFRGGIYQHNTGGPYNATQVQDVTIRHTYRRGIQISTAGTGDAVTGCIVDDVTVGEGIATWGQTDITGNTVNAIGRNGIQSVSNNGLLSGNNVSGVGNLGVVNYYGAPQITNNTVADTLYCIATRGDATITGNVITSTRENGVGIFSAGDDYPNGNLVTIQGNIVGGLANGSIGMFLVNMDNGSLVGGPAIGNPNTINVNSPTVASYGMIVEWTPMGCQTTIQNNRINVSGINTGILVYHNEDPTKPTLLVGNEIIGTAITGTAPGEGTGVLITDEGDFVGESGGDTYATLTGNVISGFTRGIDLYRNESTNASTRDVVVTIGGAALADSNTVTGCETGIRVFEVDNSANGGYRGVAFIQGNMFAISNNGAGIEVDGGFATITQNRLSGNQTAIRVKNTGSISSVSENLIEDSTQSAIEVASGSAGTISSNSFTGAAPFLVRNLAPGVVDASSNWWGSDLGANIAPRMIGSVDYTPYFHTGIDAQGATLGFQGDYSILHAIGSSAQTGAMSRIEEAVALVPSAGTVILEAGIFDESSVIQKTVTITGRVADPPEAVVRPSVKPATNSVIEIGDTTNGSLVTPNVTLEYARIDCTSLQTVLGAQEAHQALYVRPGAQAAIRHCLFAMTGDAHFGNQNAAAVVTLDANADIESSEFRDLHKAGIVAYDSGTVNIRGNEFIGTNPVALGKQYSQNGIEIQNLNDPIATVQGEITGNTFLDFGPSGPENAAVGLAKVATDYTIGYCILIWNTISGASTFTVADNIFSNVQGCFLDLRILPPANAAAQAIKIGEILTSNTVEGGRYIGEGPLDEGVALYAQRCDDPNFLNLVIFSYGGYSTNEVNLGPAMFALNSDMSGAGLPLTLVGTEGLATVLIPNAALPANISAGTNATLTQIPTVADLAAARAAGPGAGPMRVLGPVIATVRTDGLNASAGRHQFYIQDASGADGQTAIQVDDPSFNFCETYEIGDVLVRMVGTVDQTTFATTEGLVRAYAFAPLGGPSRAGTAPPPAPIDAALAPDFASIEGELVVLDPVDVNGTGFFAADTSYSIVLPTGIPLNTVRIEDASELVGRVVPGSPFGLIGVAVRIGAQRQIQPRINADLIPPTSVSDWPLWE